MFIGSVSAEFFAMKFNVSFVLLMFVINFMYG